MPLWKNAAARVRVVILGVSVVLLTWLGSSDIGKTGYSLVGRQGDYYNLLAAGFLDGHSYMKADVHPDRFNPDVNVRSKAPYLLDAAFYGRHYYLYYGVAPAVLLVLPYTLLTGQDLSINGAVAAFVLLGFLFYVLTYSWCRIRYFPGISRTAESIHILLLAFASVTPCLLVRGIFYELPIAAGYAAQGALGYCLLRALHARGSPLRWLAAASVAGGLAVGCRPPLILALPAVAAVAFIVGRRNPATDSRAGFRLAAAAVLPAAFLGVLLAGYNFARFGNPIDTGFAYGVNAFFETGKPLQSAAFVWPNAKWYYFSPPALTPYFPYVAPISAEVVPPAYYSDEAVNGQWLALVLCLLLIAAFALGKGRPPLLPRLQRFFLVLAWIFVAEFAFMVVLGVRANRYMVDFQAPLILLCALVGGWLEVRPVTGRRGIGLVRGASLVTALALVAFNILTSFQQFGDFPAKHSRLYPRMEYLGNWPSHLLARMGLLQIGPVSFTAVFAPTSNQRSEPLLAAGLPIATDTLVAAQHPGGLVEFLLDHKGSGGPRSEVIRIEYGRPYEIEVDMGAFYPPRAHPYFDGWKTRDVEIRKTAVRVHLDGREIISTLLQTYDAPSNSIYFGRSPNGRPGFFSGRITAARRIAASDPAAAANSRYNGIWRLRAKFPERDYRVNFPLLASGLPGAGNLLVVEVLDERSLRFGIDFWGAGMRNSEPVQTDLSAEHTIDVVVGPLVRVTTWPTDWQVDPGSLEKAGGELAIWFDGKPVWRTPIFANADSYDFVTIGRNQIGFSSAPAAFPGLLENVKLGPPELREVLGRFVPAAKME